MVYLTVFYKGGIVKGIHVNGDYWSIAHGSSGAEFLGDSGQIYIYNQGLTYTDTKGITSWFYMPAIYGGYITAQTDGTGAAKYYNYDANGRLISVSDSGGRTIKYGYADTTSKLINTITDPNGNVYQLNYDSTNHLTQIIYPDLSTKQLSYDSTGKLTSIVDEYGNTASYLYLDENCYAGGIQYLNCIPGTLATYYAPGGFGTFNTLLVGPTTIINGQVCNVTFVDYAPYMSGEPVYYWLKNSLGNGSHPVVEQVGPLRPCEACSNYNGVLWPGEQGIQWTGYDSLGNKISQTDFNENLTTWSGYDRNGDYQYMTTACGSPTSSIYGTPYSSTTEYTWNAQLHQPTTITTTSIVGGPHKITYYNYNSSNELLSITQTGFTYDYKFKTPTGMVRPIYSGYEISYSYDNLGNLTRVVNANGIPIYYGKYNVRKQQ